MTELMLEDRLLNQHANTTLHEFTPILDNLKIMIGKNIDSKELGNLAEKTISIYGGIYKSVKEKTTSSILKNNGSEAFFKLLATYVACEGTKQLLQNGSSTDISLSILEGYSANSYYVDVSRSDNAALADTFRIIGDALGYSSNTQVAKNSVISTLDKISQITVNRLYSSPNIVQEYLNTNFKGKNFEVEKPAIESKKDKTKTRDKDQYTKGLQDYVYSPIYPEDFVGCEDELNFLDTNISCQMHYDSNTKNNPFEGFPQFILLAGPPGTAKTMLANYYSTKAKDLGEKHGKKVRISKFDIASMMQMGPLINAENQLTEISRGDFIDVSILDEMDKKFSNGNDIKEYMDQVYGALLRFRGGSEFPNFHNYVMIGTSNNPERIHKGIIDVFKVIELKGPKNTDERMRILEMNLKEGFKLGYVRIDDSGRNQIYEELDKHQFMGRSMKNIAVGAKTKYLSIASIIDYGKNYDQVKSEIARIVSRPNCPYVTTTNDIIKSIKQEANKIKSIHSYV